MTYETEYSNFPSENITLHGFKNIDDASVTYTLDGKQVTTTIDKLIAQINQARISSVTADKIAVANLINAVKEKIKPYMVDAETFNTWEQEIYNTQLYAKNVLQSVHFDTTEPDCQEQDVWIGN